MGPENNGFEHRVYRGNTFGKIHLEKDGVSKEKYEFIAFLISGFCYFPLDIELIKILATHYYKICGSYFFIRERNK